MRRVAEQLLHERYRLPEDILEQEIVEETERIRIEKCIRLLDSFSLESTVGVQVSWRGEEPHPPGEIYFRLQHSHPEGRWFKFSLNEIKNRTRNEPHHWIVAFVAFLDIDRIEDYYHGLGDVSGKGCELCIKERGFL